MQYFPDLKNSHIDILATFWHLNVLKRMKKTILRFFYFFPFKILVREDFFWQNISTNIFFWLQFQWNSGLHTFQKIQRKQISDFPKKIFPRKKMSTELFWVIFSAKEKSAKKKYFLSLEKNESEQRNLNLKGIRKLILCFS